MVSALGSFRYLASNLLFRMASAAFSGNLLLLRRKSSHVVLPCLFISVRCLVSKVFVGGLSYHTSERSLADSFKQFGQVVEARIVTERDSDRSKGFGFVSYAYEDEARSAIEGMNGKELNGRVVFVDIANGRHVFRKRDYIIERGTMMTQGATIAKVTKMMNSTTTATRKQIQNEKLKY